MQSTCWQLYRCQYHESICIQSVFIVFAIYPKLLNIFYSTLLPIFHRNISPLLSNLSTMALTKTTKTSSIIKTRSQSRTGTNVAVPTGRTTGTNKRTIDSVDPVVTTNDPVPVTNILFAGRPNTGALKDPPPVAVPVLAYCNEASSSRSRYGLRFGRRKEACCEAYQAKA